MALFLIRPRVMGASHASAIASCPALRSPDGLKAPCLLSRSHFTLSKGM
jgi:hypothetical protein